MQSRLTHQNAGSSGSNGSFYESIPSIIESVQKPVSDDILKRLKESTRSDKRIEWRMRSKYEGGFGDHFDGGEGSDECGSRSELCWRRDARSELRGDERRYFRENGSVKPRFVRDDWWSSGITREECRRRGHVYGPQAIAAVSGQRVPRYSVWESLSSQSPRLHGVHYDDDGNCPPPQPQTHPWAQKRGMNSTRKKLTDRNLDQRRADLHNFMKTDLNSRIDELLSDVSSGCSFDAGRLDVGTVAKVNVTIGAPFLGGDPSSKASKLRDSGKKLCQGTRKPLRRKQKGVVSSKRKSLSKTRVIDKRHKGPRIAGINSKNFSGADDDDEARPRIRTVVLPYPLPKYRHTM